MFKTNCIKYFLRIKNLGSTKIFQGALPTISPVTTGLMCGIKILKNRRLINTHNI